MIEIANLLRAAAGEVERRGVLHEPSDVETCAWYSIFDAATVHPELSPFEIAAERMLIWSSGCGSVGVEAWNDAQPSRAVVAAEMRSAAQLAELIGDRL